MAETSPFQIESVHNVSKSHTFNASKGGNRGVFNGISVCQIKNDSGNLINSLEELSISIGSKLGGDIKKLKISAQKKSLIDSPEDLHELLEKMPGMKNGTATKEIFDELINHHNPTKQYIIDTLLKRFKDPSYQYVALRSLQQYTKNMIAKYQEKDDQRMQNKYQTLMMQLNGALTYVMDQHGSSKILAGINIIDDALFYADKIETGHEHLMDFYRDSVIDYKSLTACYKNVLERMELGKPVEEGNVSLDDAYEDVIRCKFVSICDYLLGALSSDLKAKGSSIEKVNLSMIIKDVENIRLLKNLFVEFLRLAIIFKVNGK